MSQLVSVSSPASGREMLERAASVALRLRGPMRRQAPLANAPQEPQEPPPEPRRLTTIDRIIEAVADKYNVSVSELLSDRKATHVVIARQEAMWRCLAETRETLWSVAFSLNRNPKTVAEGAARHSDRTGVPRPRMLASWTSIGKGRRWAAPVDACPKIGAAIRARLLA